MAFVSSAIPNLIGGVSQQPPEIRALNCSTALVNTWCDVVTGLSTRPSGDYLGKVGLAPTTGKTVATHVINKADGDYMVSVYDGAVKVSKLDGTFTVQTVTVDGGADAYLSGVDDCAANIGFVTVGDTTFIYNRSMTVTKTATAEGSGLTGTVDDGTTRLNPNRHATIWVRQAAGYTANYTVYYNGVLAGNEVSSSTAAKNIADPLFVTLDATYDMLRPTVTVMNIELIAEGDFIAVRDDFGDQALVGYNDAIEEFTDLPNIDSEGRLVKIENGIEENADDYWVWFKDGRWVETYGWNAYEKIDDDTMPIILVHDGGSSWTLQYTTYPGREVGDADSNPTPSFVGSTIRYMGLYKGRMVILSDENFIASRISNFENYYRQTCTQLLDEDPIDIASANSRGAPLNFAKEFDKELLLFTSYDQFRIAADGEGLLSPNTVTIRKTNSYNNSPSVEPAYIGPNVAFVDDFGQRGYVTLREYQVDRNFGTEVALPVTDAVPEFIPSGVYKLIGSSTYNNLIVASSGDRSSLWLYNYYFNSEGKVQSAWQRWEFVGEVHGVDYSRDQLVVSIVYDGDLHLLSCVFDAGADTELDKESICFDYGCDEVLAPAVLAGTNSVITLPFAVAEADEDLVCLVVSPSVPGSAIAAQTYTPASVVGDTVTFNNVDLTTSEYVVGLKYQFAWTLSPIYMRDRNQVAIQDGRLQLRRISLLYNNSGPFSTEFTPQSRDAYTSTFSAFLVGSGGDELGSLSLDSGEFRVAVNGAGEKLDLTVSAWTPWRVRFSTIEWGGSWRPKKRRV